MKKNRKREGNFVIEKNDSIKAVYKSELEGFLESIGMLADFKAGKVVCKYCGRTITEENLLAFIPVESSHYDVCCTDTKCNMLFVQNANEPGA